VLIDFAGNSDYNEYAVIYLWEWFWRFWRIYKRKSMAVDTEIKNAVNAADKDAQYDERAKRLLGNKSILAHILVKTVDEFQGMNPKEVV